MTRGFLVWRIRRRQHTIYPSFFTVQPMTRVIIALTTNKVGDSMELQAKLDDQGRIRLSGMDVWEQVLQESHRRPVLVFKHSATCPISAEAYKQWMSVVEDPGDAPQVLHSYLIVQEDRPVSNAIAERLGVRHESPQAILIHRGQPVWHTSHSAITRTALQQALAATAGDK